MKIRTTLVVALLMVVTTTQAQWQPPENPDPQQILNEASADRDAKRYEIALAKHLWFHRNALKYRESLSAVRLSFALAEWVDLAKLYPPALEKLKAVRDEAEGGIRESNVADDKSWGAFSDFEAINKYLGDDGKTRDLFVWLDENRPKLATLTFPVAEPALIQFKVYKLCGKYIDPVPDYDIMVTTHHLNLKFAKNPKFEDRLRDFAVKSFTNKTATLVALLILNDRFNEAKAIADKARQELTTEEFGKVLDKAMLGEIPPPYP